MPCFVALFALISPRLALFFILVFSNWIGRAFDGGWVLPILGFFLLPWTTLAYVVMYRVQPPGVEGFEWFVVILAFLADIASYAGSRDARRPA